MHAFCRLCASAAAYLVHYRRSRRQKGGAGVGKGGGGRPRRAMITTQEGGGLWFLLPLSYFARRNYSTCIIAVGSRGSRLGGVTQAVREDGGRLTVFCFLLSAEDYVRR